MKARQKNKQAEKYEFIFKINKECMALPIPQKLIDKMKEIMKLAQENREYEEAYTGYNVLNYPVKPLVDGE